MVGLEDETRLPIGLDGNFSGAFAVKLREGKQRHF